MHQVSQKPSGRRPARTQRGRAATASHQEEKLLRRAWLFGAVVLLIGVALLVGMTQGRPAATSAPPAPAVGHTAPAIALTTPDGATVSLADLRGKVVLVNFWATWCPPCRAEMPAIQAAYERYRERGFTVLAVTADEDRGGVESFLRDNGLSFPALLDPGGATHSTYLANALPSSFFIDRAGVVRAVHRGPMTAAVIDAQLRPLFATP